MLRPMRHRDRCLVLIERGGYLKNYEATKGGLSQAIYDNVRGVRACVWKDVAPMTCEVELYTAWWVWLTFGICRRRAVRGAQKVVDRFKAAAVRITVR